jgi:hypothetical protein
MITGIYFGTILLSVKQIVHQNSSIGFCSGFGQLKNDLERINENEGRR